MAHSKVTAGAAATLLNLLLLLLLALHTASTRHHLPTHPPYRQLTGHSSSSSARPELSRPTSRRGERGMAVRSWSSSRGARIHAFTFNYTQERQWRAWAHEEVVDLEEEQKEDEEEEQGDHVDLSQVQALAAAAPPQEGLHLLVLHQRTARVLVRRVFLTQEPYTWWADLVWWVGRVAPGRLVVMTAGGGATLGLRRARALFGDLGSVFAGHLGYRTSWCWAFLKGGRTVYEALARGTPVTQLDYGPEHTSGNVCAEGLVLPLFGPYTLATSVNDEERWQYCAAHGAMGGLCDEYSPDPLPGPTCWAVAHQAALAGVPVVVTAGNRYQYLYHTLTTLLAAPGAQHDNLLVVLGDAPPATTQLLRLINVNFTTLPVQGRDNNKLFRYYRSVFHLVAHTFPDAPAIILLDEDVQVSPDFFSFMSQTLWLLHADPTLYCINAFSFLPDMRRGRGPQYVRRGSVQVSWAYAVTPTFVREALSSWPTTAEGQDIHTYDYWLYDKVRGGRECVYPEVSRARHYGVGVNTEPYLHEYEAWRRPLLHASPVTLLNAHKMLHDVHETDFLRGLESAAAIDFKTACDPEFPAVAGRSSRPMVVYFIQEEPEHITSWFEVGQCAGLHVMSEQESHYGAHLAFYPHRQPQQQQQQPSLGVSHPHHQPQQQPSLGVSHHHHQPLQQQQQQQPSLGVSHHHHQPQQQPSLGVSDHHHQPLQQQQQQPSLGEQHPLNRYGFNHYTPQDLNASDTHHTRVYYVGVPFSRYSRLRPDAAPVFDALKLSPQEIRTNHARFTDTLDILFINTTHSYHTLIASVFTTAHDV
ncbi:LOW QUALITY PROTEIN: protein O-linked-mannose beta-1,2-N-acetylglucosaminyltransferase 1-like [Panulirus ornatus]|uniref:LOW QUALITY PROTEIN: protein O-linked-mannose beta-1,2-N-acetylglucosaminyltransferase 1-like n=1 Tax=Panulirus ornatus TaxID=150431 RepID=UPI003A8954A9